MTENRKRISGEGRVTFVKYTHAFLAKAGLDGGIFVVPSSILGQQSRYPGMNELLNRNDLVYFEAEPQTEKNGIKYVALDGTVKVIGKAQNITCRGVATVTKVDERYGQYGFMESEIHGGIFFNANVVRPETSDVTKILKAGQKVIFEAIHQKNQPQCKYRATLVHLKSYKKGELRESKKIPFFQAAGLSKSLTSSLPHSTLGNTATFSRSPPPLAKIRFGSESPKLSEQETEFASTIKGISKPKFATTPGKAPAPPICVQSHKEAETTSLYTESARENGLFGASVFSDASSHSRYYREAPKPKSTPTIPVTQPLAFILNEQCSSTPSGFPSPRAFSMVNRFNHLSNLWMGSLFGEPSSVNQSQERNPASSRLSLQGIWEKSSKSIGEKNDFRCGKILYRG